MDYKESLEFLYSQLPMFSRVGAPAYKPGLDTTIALAKLFDNPQDKFKSVHVGGTNGKGSVSHILASVLQSAGYKVGLYTSPHLVDFRERMKINGKMISQKEVTECVEKWKAIEKDLSDTGTSLSPSFFELTMIMAFDWFAKEKVDIAIVEVGMGGRLDSTNIITPELSVITNISHDHNQFLGDTLEKIASEKAGIIKKNTPVVIGERQPETEKVFRDKAEEMESIITFADDCLLWEEPYFEATDTGWHIEYQGHTYTLPLAGDYQKKNFITAFQALKRLQVDGWEISNEAMFQGISGVCDQTGFAGRWSILDRHPLTIADTGHNIAGLEYNFRQLGHLMESRPDGRLRIVIGFVADKAIDKIMALLPVDALYYVTNAQIPRALPAEKLLEKFEEKGLNARKYPDVVSAYWAAKEEASRDDVIFVGGSTFIVADLLAGLR